MRPLSALQIALLWGLWISGGAPAAERPSTVGALSKRPPPVGTQVAVTGYILMVVRCPPCPSLGECRPCKDEFILIADRPDARTGILMLRTTRAQQKPLARGQRRAFTIRFEPESGGPREGPIRRGIALIEAGPALPRPRP